MDKHKISAIILAGGQSKRMGKDKSSVVFMGETLLDHVVKALKNHPLVSQIIVSINKEPEKRLPFADYVFDDVPHLGPLGGILASLKISKNELNFIIACDMPFVNSKAINELVSYADEYDVVVPQNKKGIEPLFGIYKKSCMNIIEVAMKRGDRRVIDFYPDVKVLKIPVDMIKSACPEKDFYSINTPEELEKAKSLIKE